MSERKRPFRYKRKNLPRACPLTGKRMHLSRIEALMVAERSRQSRGIRLYVYPCDNGCGYSPLHWHLTSQSLTSYLKKATRKQLLELARLQGREIDFDTDHYHRHRAKELARIIAAEKRVNP